MNSSTAGTPAEQARLGVVPIRRALISVSDKSGILDFARMLRSHGVNIISTGGTAKTLAMNEVPVEEVYQYTGFPEMMDGRVKTLHPKIHAGLLARRGFAKDTEEMAKAHYGYIDLVVVNLYPFAQTVAKPGCTLEEAIENIDIGGPTMIRAAAKNHESVAVVTDPGEYERFGKCVERFGGTTLEYRRHLMWKAFYLTHLYDGDITDHFEPFGKVPGYKFDWEGSAPQE